MRAMQTAAWSRAGSSRWLCAGLAAALALLAVGAARADEPAVPAAPPASAVPPAPTTPVIPPASAAPIAPAPAAPAAPAPAAPIAPAATEPIAPPVSGDPGSAPTLTAEPPAVPPPALEAPAPPPPPPRKPFYRKDWFWGAVGVVVLTVGIVLIATSGSDAKAPSTTLGNMRAF